MGKGQYRVDRNSAGSVHALLRLQNTILELIAKGADLENTCTRLCNEVELLLPDVKCSVLSVEETGCLRPLAGPSLPESLSDAIDGVSIGPSVGSCGTAAYLASDVAVVDIATDPKWTEFKKLALPHDLRACWSSPVIDARSIVIATFALYFRECRGPTPFEIKVVRNCVDLCIIAIDRHKRVREHEHRAWTDALTGLPNRAAFNAELQKLDCRAPGGWAIFVLDLDNLKIVNDTFGHPAGDLLLQTASDRIASASYPNRTYRVGGDEFAILIESPEALRDLDAAAEKIIRRLAKAADCGGQIIVPRATIGGAVCSDNEPAAELVRKNADFALYHAKETGRGGFVRYWPGLGSTMAKRLGAIRDVTAALRDGRIDAFYQPIFRLDTREIVGLEALCRMQIGDQTIPASAFHEATSDSYVAAAMTARMMGIVAADVRRWLDMGIPFQHVGINISSADLSGGAIERVLTCAFEREGVSLKHVILEVTETVYIGEGDQAVQGAIRALRAKGIRVALDDFGTGFASLTHLLTVPVDIIKIDKTFIDHLDTDAVSMTIVESLIRIAEKLGIRVVAEGVETEKQVGLLHSAGCVLAQGFVCSRAVDRDEMTALLLARAEHVTGSATKVSGFGSPR